MYAFYVLLFAVVIMCYSYWWK